VLENKPSFDEQTRESYNRQQEHTHTHTHTTKQETQTQLIWNHRLLVDRLSNQFNMLDVLCWFLHCWLLFLLLCFCRETSVHIQCALCSTRYTTKYTK